MTVSTNKVLTDEDIQDLLMRQVTVIYCCILMSLAEGVETLL